MSVDELHVVFGTGQVGNTLTRRLRDLELPVRAVSLHRPVGLPDGVDWWVADATEPEAAGDAAKGASVVYQCLNAPYGRWPKLFPPLQAGGLSAARRADALFVTLENVYGYGPTGGAPLTEDLPLAATGPQGRTRVAMTRDLLAAAAAGDVRIAIGRASDFFGPGGSETTLGQRVFGRAIAGKPAMFLGNADLAHTYSYLPDIAAGLATLGTDARAVGEVWHLPGPETVTTRAVLDLVAGEVGHPVTIRSLPQWMVRALGVVSPTMRALGETAYQFDEPFVLDTTKFESTFGSSGTSLGRAVADTVAWYQRQRSARG